MQSHRAARRRQGCGGPARRSLAVVTSAVASVAAVSLPAPANAGSGAPAKAVSGVTVAVILPYPGATALYTVDFKATATVAAGGGIFLSETAGPTDFASGRAFR